MIRFFGMNPKPEKIYLLSRHRTVNEYFVFIWICMCESRRTVTINPCLPRPSNTSVWMNQLARLSNEWVDDIKCKFEQNEITGTTKLDNSCLIYILSFGRAWVNSCVRVIRMKWQMKEGSKSKLCVWQKLRTFFGLSPFLYCQCFVSQFSAFFSFISPRFQLFRKKMFALCFQPGGRFIRI